jgi:hypothetical protein
MKNWPHYPYKAMKTNPYSIMCNNDGLRFVTCDETIQAIEDIASWQLALHKKNPQWKRGPSCIYKDGKPFKLVK